jgi:competence protein ComEA
MLDRGTLPAEPGAGWETQADLEVALMADKPDINTASREQLTEAEGIGESLAERIVRTREEQGPFRSAEDLRRIPLVDDTRLEQLKEAVSLPDDAQNR